MDKIEVQCDWSAVPRQKNSKLLAKKFYGWVPQVLILGVAAIIALLSMLAIENFAAPRNVPNNWLIAFLPFYFGYVVMVSLNGYWKKRLIKASSNAAIRQQNRPVFLSKHGVSNSGFDDKYPVDWPLITDVVETKDTTLLLISPIEYFPIQDSGLPAGLTRAALLEQITKWRAI